VFLLVASVYAWGMRNLRQRNGILLMINSMMGWEDASDDSGMIMDNISL